MIHLPSQRAVFVHNPKVAGTALASALVQAFPDAVRYWGRAYLPALDNVCDLAHISAGEMPLFLRGSDAPAFSFGLVRDPYARFVSALKHFNAYSGGAAPLSPDAFIERYLDHAALRYDWRLIHFRPQYCFFHHGGQQAVSLVGRHERFGEFLEELQGRLGRRLAVARENVGSTAAVELSGRAVAAIDHYYARDFALFGYPMRSRPAPRGTAKSSPPLYAPFEGLWPEERQLDTRVQVHLGHAQPEPAGLAIPAGIAAAPMRAGH